MISIAGFSINTLTLFGMVLVVGLLVDDAIVVVENVERLLEENPEMSPREATIQSMAEIQVALVAIAMVLSAVSTLSVEPPRVQATREVVSNTTEVRRMP